jgi:hypothetical protein
MGPMSRPALAGNGASAPASVLSSQGKPCGAPAWARADVTTGIRVVRNSG